MRRATFPPDVPPRAGWRYLASSDPATRGNAWTLTVVGWDPNAEDDRSVVVAAREWIGSKSNPLDPSAVLGEMSEVVRRYGVNAIMCDNHAPDVLPALAAAGGHVKIVQVPATAAGNLDMYERLRIRLQQGAIELPPNRALATDLLAVRKRVTSRSVSIQLPRQPSGRHWVFAPSLAMALMHVDHEREIEKSPPGGRILVFGHDGIEDLTADDEPAADQREHIHDDLAAPHLEDLYEEYFTRVDAERAETVDEDEDDDENEDAAE